MVVSCCSFTANEGDTTAKTKVKEIFLPGSYEWVIVYIKVKIITHFQIFFENKKSVTRTKRSQKWQSMLLTFFSCSSTIQK